MGKGRSFRRQPKSSEPVARIVRDVRDSSLDRFIPLKEAQDMEAEEKLVEIDLGPTYPFSYSPV